MSTSGGNSFLSQTSLHHPVPCLPFNFATGCCAAYAAASILWAAPAIPVPPVPPHLRCLAHSVPAPALVLFFSPLNKTSFP